MTHDQLAQFAAGKIDAKIVYDQSEGLGWLYEWEPGRWKRFDLSSPNLMLKGMEVARHGDIHVVIESDEVKLIDTTAVWVEKVAIGQFPYGIPLTFWTAWAKLEKGEN